MWHSPTNKMCDFEWKRHHDNITMQECPLNENHEKISFYGKYDDRTCGISFIATAEDTGIWKCEVEEYVWGGGRNSGRKVFATMNVTVQATTTRSPPPPSTTTTSTITTTTTKTTTTSTTTTTITATAAVVYEREAKASQDTANMMRNSNNAELGSKDGQTSELDNKHLHEFFPHSKSFT